MNPKNKIKIGLVVPHIFMWDKLLKTNIYAPGQLAKDFADTLHEKGFETFLFSCGPVKVKCKNITINIKKIEIELRKNGDSVDKLIKKHLDLFKTLKQLVQLEIISNAYKFASQKRLDILHIFHTESIIDPIFSSIIDIPTLFTIHDPYKFVLPNKKFLPLIKNTNFSALSLSQASFFEVQKKVPVIYNGLKLSAYKYNSRPKDYFAYLGRIIKPKGCHIAVKICKETNQKLKIAGIHYEGHGEDNYWSTKIKPFIDGKRIKYCGFINNLKEKSRFYGNAKALLFPARWEEPFGLVIIEAMACGTPVIAFDYGSVKEIIENGKNGFIVKTKREMINAMKKVDCIDRNYCRKSIERKFTIEKMTDEYLKLYKKIIAKSR